MLKAALLFIPLLSGYIFIRTWKFTNYRVVREEFQKLYFRAAFHGLCIAGYTALTVINIKLHFPEFCLAIQSATEMLIPLSGILVDKDDSALPIAVWTDGLLFISICLMWGCCLGFFLNQLSIRLDPVFILIKQVFPGLPEFGKENNEAWRRSFRRVVELIGDDMEHILLAALDRSKPVLITMANMKVYVGAVIETNDLKVERKYVRIAPLLSGYRDSGNLEVIFTTNYSAVYQKILLNDEERFSNLKLSDFEIVLPLGSICSISLFDLDAYKEFSQPSHLLSPADSD
jgi:hypothetical protein